MADLLHCRLLITQFRKMLRLEAFNSIDMVPKNKLPFSGISHANFNFLQTEEPRQLGSLRAGLMM